MAYAIPASLGEFLDRLSILWTKVAKFSSHRRHDSLKRFYKMERELDIPAEHDAAVQAIYKQLVDIHQRLFDAEDEIRIAAVTLPVKQAGSSVGWLDAATADKTVAGALVKYLQASNTIRLLNEARHRAIAQIDAVVGDSGEAKQYGAASPSVVGS